MEDIDNMDAVLKLGGHAYSIYKDIQIVQDLITFSGNKDITKRYVIRQKGKKK